MGTADVIDRDAEARKHLWSGLERLPPAGRVAFLSHCVGQVKGPGGVGVRVTGHSGTVAEAYYDVCLAAVAYGFDLYRACEALESWLKRGADRWPWEASSPARTAPPTTPPAASPRPTWA